MLKSSWFNQHYFALMSYCGVDTCILLSFLYFSTESSLNLFGMGLFGATHGWGVHPKGPLP